ncbi:MAG: RNA-binding domain-containing protein [Desulfococcaceae bacterium]|nr:RNA-binding domain-containing protein [Desulfococcaceae bacterium]
MDIYQIIRNGEDSRTEFKSADFHNDSLAKEIAAFSNMSGGEIFIGISDTGMIEGAEDKQIEERVINICRNNLIPPVIPEISFIHTEEKKILHISVGKGKFKPFKVRSSNKYYIRVGSVSIEPTNEELIRLFQDGSQFHFEVSRLPGTSVDNIDLLKFRLYCKDYRQMEWEDKPDFRQLLYNFQIIDENACLTVAGALFFGSDTSRFLPQSGIDMNCFEGNDLTDDMIDYKSLDGTIPELIGAAEQFVKINSRIKPVFNKDETRRTDRYDYEPFVVRELICNAFMHRDWSVFGQKIRINLFRNRVEVFSPGKIPNTLNLVRALSGISYYRNPIIAQMLKDYKFAEKAGRGLQKIMKFHKDNKLRPPDFDIDGEYFKVIVHNANG